MFFLFLNVKNEFTSIVLYKLSAIQAIKLCWSKSAFFDKLLRIQNYLFLKIDAFMTYQISQDTPIKASNGNEVNSIFVKENIW